MAEEERINLINRYYLTIGELVFEYSYCGLKYVLESLKNNPIKSWEEFFRKEDCTTALKMAEDEPGLIEKINNCVKTINEIDNEENLVKRINEIYKILFNTAGELKIFTPADRKKFALEFNKKAREAAYNKAGT